MKKLLTVVFVLLLALSFTGNAQEDKSTDKKLYVVATAHLDTQWRWTIQDTITKFIPQTLKDNFALFEKFDDYVFSFEGAFRYMLMKEYYPDDYEKLKKYISEGRWAVCGSWVDAVDTNIPSPEALIRQTLYGNGFFQREFGKKSYDIFLPDCFGFSYVLPTVAAHCGLKGFSSQKLTWGSSVGIPFDIGLWEGVDGSKMIAALNPDDYVSTIREDLSTGTRWLEKIDRIGNESGLFLGYKYFGVGDQGGGPDDESVEWLHRSIMGDGPIKVFSSPADAMYKALDQEQKESLPQYNGELLMTTHGAGCYTSQAAMKRFNRKNELLADYAERASVIADWLGGTIYPREKLNDAWIRFLWHDFHDDLTGTSIPEAYTFSWNDEIISLNQFSAVLKNSIGAITRGLDTNTKGIPLVIYNPLGFERYDTVEATVQFKKNPPSSIIVLDENNKKVPVQITSRNNKELTIVFPAAVPSVGLVVYNIIPSNKPVDSRAESDSTEMIQNNRYLVKISRTGDIESITDKSNGIEYLSGDVKFDLLENESSIWPAWEILYDTVKSEPIKYEPKNIKKRVVESGPVRTVIEVSREIEGSQYLQRIKLNSIAGMDYIEIENVVDWKSPGKLLKAAFPFTATNEKATYDLGIGTIERPNNAEKKYEVPAQQWADISKTDGKYGVAVLNDCKYGWDKPDDSTLRLTLLHTPATRGGYRDQRTQDIGQHRFKYGILPHDGNWKAASVPGYAARFNQPLLAFAAERHPGKLGRKFSFIQLNNDGIGIKAIKKAENSDDIIIRVQELYGENHENVVIKAAVPILSAVEVNGQEETIGPAKVEGGKLIFNIGRYNPKTFAIRLQKSALKMKKLHAETLNLKFDSDGFSYDGDKSDGNLDGSGHTFPAELIPDRFISEDLPFVSGPRENGKNNLLTCSGQKITIPKGNFTDLYILAVATEGDQIGTFTIGKSKKNILIHNFTGFIGQWYSRVLENGVTHDLQRIKPAFMKKAHVVWVGTHRHNKDGSNEPYIFCYMFKYKIDLPPGTRTIILPNNDKIKIFAMTAATNPNDDIIEAQPLCDVEPESTVSLLTGDDLFLDSTTISMKTNYPGGIIRYTTEGSNPLPSSKTYTNPLTIDKTTTIRAAVFDSDDNRKSHTSSLTVKKTSLIDSITPANLTDGLNYKYYEGKWRSLPDFASLSPAKNGVVSDFSIELKNQSDYMGFEFEGYIKIVSEGLYKFYLDSDDGSKLWIDDKLLIDNDGLHGSSEETASIGLAAGYHSIKVQYFERGGDQMLSVSFSGPGIEKQEIPAEVLYRQQR